MLRFVRLLVLGHAVVAANRAQRWMNMATLRLSSKAEEGLRALTSLREDELRDVAAALTELLPVKLAVQDDIADVISAARPDDNDAQVELLSSAVFGLHFMRAAEQRSKDEWAADIAQTLSEGGEEPQIAALRAKLTIILAVPTLQAAAKAWSLLDDHDKVYAGCKVITDIRPIFGDEIGAPLLGSLICHTLKLTTRTNDTAESSFVVCDNEDIQALIKNLQRALDKSAFLRRLIREHPNREFGAPLDRGDIDEQK